MATDSSNTNLNIYQKLADIRSHVEVMQKSEKAYNYWYTKEEDILAKITVYMKKHHVSLIPSIVPQTLSVSPHAYTKTKTTKQGDPYEVNVNEILVYAEMTWAWVNDDDPNERIVVPWAMIGMQEDGSQAFGSGLTYASRYFLLKYFNISTSEDDPDKFRAKQKDAEREQDVAIAKEITQNIDAYLKEYLGKNPDKREDVVKLVKNYVKSGDYFKIEDPATAGKLLQEAQSTFA